MWERIKEKELDTSWKCEKGVRKKKIKKIKLKNK